MNKKLWILGIVMMVLSGLMTSCDNGTTNPDYGRVVEEKYRGYWEYYLPSDPPIYFELFETTLVSPAGFPGYIPSDTSHVCTINNELWLFYTAYPEDDEYWTLVRKLGTFVDDDTIIIHHIQFDDDDRTFKRKTTP